MFLTWFNPGPGTGFMFMVGNLLTLLLVVALASLVSNRLSLEGTLEKKLVVFTLILVCYLICYIGLTRLVMGLIDRFVVGGIFLSALLCFLFVIAGIFIPWIAQSLLYSSMRWTHEYTAFQVPNFFWTLIAWEERELTDISWGLFRLPLEVHILAAAATGMTLINMVLAAREVELQREAAPHRVQEEEAVLHPKKAATPVASSPWDSEPTA
jgi:hypothetical protein